MRIAPAALIVLLVLHLPLGVGAGFEGFRLPLGLAIAALLLADLAAMGAVGGGRRAAAAAALLAVHAFSLLGARAPADGIVPLLILGAGTAVYLYARSPRLSATFARDRVPELLAVAALAFAALGLFQWVRGRDPVSTLGNRNYAGAVAAMLLPPLLAAAGATPCRGKRAALGGACALLAGYLLLTESRAGLIAAFLGCLLMAGLLLRGRPPGLRWSLAGAAALLAAGLAQLPFQTGASRIETGDVRRELWRGALRMALDRPWTGWGAGGFRAAYPPYRSLEEARISQKYQPAHFVEAEDPHSSWMQVLAETGVPGLLAFLGVALLGGLSLRLRLRESASDPALRLRLAGLGAGAAAYLVAGTFNTLTIHSVPTILFWLYLGLIDREEVPRPGPAARILVGLFAVGLGSGAWTTFSTARAEGFFARAMETRDPAGRETLLQRALGSDPGHWKSRAALASAHLAQGRRREAIEAARTVLETRPHHAPSINNVAVALLGAGAVDEAEEWLQRAERDAPHCYLTAYHFGGIELLRKRPERARERFRAALDLNPGHAASQFSLGETFLLEGNLPSAVEAFRRARALGLDVAGALRAEHPGRAGDPSLAEFFR